MGWLDFFLFTLEERRTKPSEIKARTQKQRSTHEGYGSWKVWDILEWKGWVGGVSQETYTRGGLVGQARGVHIHVYP
jgi:hypothetical protein